MTTCDLPSPKSSSYQVSTSHSLNKHVSYDKLSVSYQSFLVSIFSMAEPKSFKQVVLDENWKKTMEKEIKALEANQTWILTLLPPNKKTIGCKWVYKIKHKQDGSIEYYKVSLVEKGYN